MSRLQIYESKRWLHREKSILAVTLAYSLIRLHESPWLQNQWNSDNINFVDEKKSGQVVERFQLRRPFTRSKVKPVLAEASCPTSSTECSAPNGTRAANINGPRPRRAVHRNAHLHALGVVLIELYLNRSIEPDVASHAATYGAADYKSVAIDLLEEHSDDMAMTAEYNRATRFCLSPHPNPYSGSFSFEDQGFR